MSRVYTAKGGFRNSIVHAGETPLRQHTKHSPDGHAWGYGGSGPSQLAYDLLWDVYGEEPSPNLYQAFKFAVIAVLDSSSGFTLTEDEIRTWVEDHGGFIGVKR